MFSFILVNRHSSVHQSYRCVVIVLVSQILEIITPSIFLMLKLCIGIVGIEGIEVMFADLKKGEEQTYMHRHDMCFFLFDLLL